MAPGIYIEYGYHEKFGHPKDFPGKADITKKLKTDFIENQLP